MIDLKRVEDYRENNRIEAKKALGGLPKSIWETYSAFANSLGGVILLGVREEKDKSLHPVCLPEPEKLVEEFWQIVNDPTRVSVNVLTKKQVEIVGDRDRRFIAVTVPRVGRQDRPVYIGTDPYLGSYRRNGEGDYRCGAEEVKSMLRDRAKTPRDMRPIFTQNSRALHRESVQKYRSLVLKNRPFSPLARLDEKSFLQEVGVLIKDGKGVYRPTGAGLLMLGKYASIQAVYPHYRLRFERGKTGEMNADFRPFNRIFEGNLFDFFTYVNDTLLRALQTQGADAQAAATETLANCLVNADYHARSGVYASCKRDEISFSNPGGFRFGVEVAKTGGVSDPRNVGLLRLFQLMGVGNGTGSGIPAVYASWGKEGRGVPVIKESFHPERVSVILPLSDRVNRKNILRSKASQARFFEAEKRAMIECVTERISVTVGDICSLLRLPSERVKSLLAELTGEGILRREGNRYFLKS